MTISQRGAIAAKAAPLFQEEARKREFAGTLAPIGTRGRVADIVAEKLDISPRTVSRALEVQRNDPEAFEKVEAGEITLNAANREQEKRHSRKLPDAPKSARQIQNAEAAKKKMVTALSTVTGLCRGLDELNTDMVLSV